MSEEQNSDFDSLIQELKSMDINVVKRALHIAKNISKPPPITNQGLLNKVGSFATAYASRGLSNNKAAESVKSLRVLSCHGGAGLEPCPYRQNSEKFSESYFCGGCGCGDKSSTQLINVKNDKGEEQYSKLDFPKVVCPLHMPGFSNYVESSQEETKNSRKVVIETSYGVEYIKNNSNLNNGEVKVNENNNQDQQNHS